MKGKEGCVKNYENEETRGTGTWFNGLKTEILTDVSDLWLVESFKYSECCSVADCV